MNVTQELLKMQDAFYRDFHAKLMPTVEKEKIIGIRTPHLRAFAKKIKDTQEAREFVLNLPHRYYEENNLHAMLIDAIADPNEQLCELERLLPYVDNWATCDLMRPKALFKHPELLMANIEKWLKSEHTYTVRFAIGMLLLRFLDEDFSPELLKTVAQIKSDEYYIKMMQAWYFATALAKQSEATMPYITENRLPIWVHNKTIQKAVESFRISKEQKDFLKTLRRK